LDTKKICNKFTLWITKQIKGGWREGVDDQDGSEPKCQKSRGLYTIWF
jgi:hypothetical protein